MTEVEFEVTRSRFCLPHLRVVLLNVCFSHWNDFKKLQRLLLLSFVVISSVNDANFLLNLHYNLENTPEDLTNSNYNVFIEKAMLRR